VYYRTSSGFSTVIVYALTNNYEGLELLLTHSGSTILFDQIAKLGSDSLECYVRKNKKKEVLRVI
jgi:predicted hotdog family 3-hydroxylacyl-ACP dehydratase